MKRRLECGCFSFAISTCLFACVGCDSLELTSKTCWNSKSSRVENSLHYLQSELRHIDSETVFYDTGKCQLHLSYGPIKSGPQRSFKTGLESASDTDLSLIKADYALMAIFLTLIVMLVKNPTNREIDRLHEELRENNKKIRQLENITQAQKFELKLLKQTQENNSERLKESRWQDSDSYILIVIIMKTSEDLSS